MTPPKKKTEKKKTEKKKTEKKKTPAIKAPAPVADVVEKLRERNLLPVVLVLLAAIVAVPFVLSNGEKAPPVEQPSSSASAADAPYHQSVVLTNQDTSVREGKRLVGEAKDPFTPHFRAESDSGSSGDSGSAGDTGASAESGSSGSSPSAGTGGASPGASVPSSNGQPLLYTHSIDAWVGVAGSKKLKLRKDLRAVTVLPGDGAQVAAFTGVPLNTPNKAYFSVSTAVANLKTTGKCVMGDDNCEILALKVGDRAKFLYSDGKTYVIRLANIQPVVTKLPG